MGEKVSNLEGPNVSSTTPNPVPGQPRKEADPDNLERAKAVLAGMHDCLERLDGLEGGGFGVTAAHLSHAIESLGRAIEAEESA